MLKKERYNLHFPSTFPAVKLQYRSHMPSKDPFSLQGKTALITGASRGLGQGMALALAQAGARVICSSTHMGGAAVTVEKIKETGGTAAEVSGDLALSNEVESIYDRSVAIYGSIDILVNNGGTIARYPALEYPREEWDRVMEVNVTSAFRLSQLVAAHMKNNGGGKIINTASMLSYSGGINVIAYTASKHAIAGVTKALANEWAAYNIQVNAIAPGYFRTDNTKQLQQDPVRSEEILRRIPAGRWGEPTDLDGTIVFLASPASDYVTGIILNVDGGWMAR